MPKGGKTVLLFDCFIVVWDFMPSLFYPGHFAFHFLAGPASCVKKYGAQSIQGNAMASKSIFPVIIAFYRWSNTYISLNFSGNFYCILK